MKRGRFRRRALGFEKRSSPDCDGHIVRAIRTISPDLPESDLAGVFFWRMVREAGRGWIQGGGASNGLVEDFLLSFFGDKGLESGHDFVAAGHDAIHLRFGQIAFGFFREFIGFQGFQFFE